MCKNIAARQKSALSLENWQFWYYGLSNGGITPLSPLILPPFRLKFAKQTWSANRARYAISKTPPFFTLAQKLPNLRPVLDFLWRAEEITTLSFNFMTLFCI